MRRFASLKVFFLENRSIRQTFFKNTFWLAFAEGITKLVKLVLIIYVARILGATEYGKFSYALAFVGIFSVFTNLGLNRIIVREFSRKNTEVKDFSSILSLRIIAMILMTAALIGASFFISNDMALRKIIWILGGYTFLDGLVTFLNFFFQARQRMEFEAMAKILRAVLLSGFGVFVLLRFPTIEYLSYAYLAAAIIALVTVFIFFHVKIYHVRPGFDVSVWEKYLRMSWPLLLAGLFNILYGQVDTLLMGYWGLITETGWYNAAYRIAGSAAIPVGLISTSFFPILSKGVTESSKRFDKAWKYQLDIMIILAFPIIAGGIVVAPRLIEFLYGEAYYASALALQILIVTIGISFLHDPFVQALFVFDQQKKFMWTSAAATAVMILASLILIPKFSLYGAAAAKLITSFVLFGAFLILVSRRTPIPTITPHVVGTVLLACISSGVMYVAVSLLEPYLLNVFLWIILGAAVYSAILLGMVVVLRKLNLSPF